MLGFLSQQLKIATQVVQLIEKLATACMRQPEGLFGARGNYLASNAYFPSHQAGRACTIQLTWTTAALVTWTTAALGTTPREPSDCGRSPTGSESTYAGQVATAKSLCPRLE